MAKALTENCGINDSEIFEWYNNPFVCREPLAVQVNVDCNIEIELPSVKRTMPVDLTHLFCTNLSYGTNKRCQGLQAGWRCTENCRRYTECLNENVSLNMNIYICIENEQIKM